MIARIEAKVELLAEQPTLGEAIDYLSPGLRRFTIGNHVLVYRPLTEGIRLLGVVHAARHIQDILEQILESES
jgi:toxin ParE1/3/4